VDAEQTLQILAAGSHLDRAGEGESASRASLPCDGEAQGAATVHRTEERGRLFKVLQTNECVYDCGFCPWRASREARRATFEPETLAGLFHAAHAAGVVDGLYLTSGVRESAVQSMDAMLKTADLLRSHYDFAGFIHLKLLPGSQRAQIQEAMRLADGVSLNLEVPTEGHLAKVSSRKRWETDLIERLGWVRDLTAEFPVDAGVTTQFVVGAAGETDRDLLERTSSVYREFDVRRAFFSPFKPVPDTPLGDRPPVPAVRVRRLYQADLLMRGYGLGVEELAYVPDGNLSFTVDPKMAGALKRPELFPVEVNTASYEELLRVPGIGPLSARRLLSRRRERLIRDPREVALCGAVLKRAAPFLLLDGRALGHLEQFIRQELRRLDTRPAIQLPLFEDK